MATIYYTGCSADGFIADARGSLDWLFGHERDDAATMGWEAFIASVGAVCLGRTTFDWVLAQHSEAATEPIYEQPTWVVTHRPLDPAPPYARVFGGDVRDLHAQMVEAAGDRHVWIVGGGELVGQFADAGLLDEVWVQHAPVTLGGGAPLLPRRLDLRLLDAQRNGDFVDVRYAIAS